MKRLPTQIRLALHVFSLKFLRSRVDLFKLEETYFVAGLQQNLRGPRNLKNELRATKNNEKNQHWSSRGGTLFETIFFGIHLLKLPSFIGLVPPKEIFIYSNNMNVEDFCQVSLGVPGRVLNSPIPCGCFEAFDSHVTNKIMSHVAALLGRLKKLEKNPSLKISPWKWTCWTQSHGGGWFRWFSFSIGWLFRFHAKLGTSSLFRWTSQ